MGIEVWDLPSTGYVMVDRAHLRDNFKKISSLGK